MAPASLDRAPRAPAQEATGVCALAGAGPAGHSGGLGDKGGAAGPGPSSPAQAVLGLTDLSSPPRLGRGPRSSGRLAGRRRPRPPPPPATASFPVAAATAGAHAGPAIRSPESETGKGGAAAAGSPAPVARRRSAAVRPRRESQGPLAGLGATAEGPACGARRSRGKRRRPRVQRPSAEARRKSARRRMASARAGGGLRRGWVLELAESAVSMFQRRRVELYRLLQSPRAERHHLGKNADLAAAAQAGRTGWAGRVSRQPARTAWPGEGSRPGRRGAGRGRDARGRAPRSAPPHIVGSAPPSCLPSSQRKGGWEREVACWLLLVAPLGSVAIFAPRRGVSSSFKPLRSVP